MYPPRRMWRGPQEEHRTVSKETEVAIPNLEALSICVFSALTMTGFLWWGRMWKLWFPPLLFGIGVFLVMLKERISMPRLGLGIPDVLPRQFNSRLARVLWRTLCFFVNSIILPIVNRGTPPIVVAIAMFFGAREMLSYWYNDVAWWADILMGISLGFTTGTAAVVYFHFKNIRDPAWPAPRWYISGESDEAESDYGDRSGYTRRLEDGRQ